jgi:RNA polymerase sigma factor (TIGR02999 family)
MSRLPDPQTSRVAKLLEELRHAPPERVDGILNQLVDAAYAEFRRIAGAALHRSGGLTMQATELVHETVLRFAGFEKIAWADSKHFYSVVARVMRRVVIDYRRKQLAARRNGGVRPIPLSELVNEPAAVFMDPESGDEDIVRLDDALSALFLHDPELASIVELKFFGGRTIEEIARLTESSPATVKRRWLVAKGWLSSRVRHSDGTAAGYEASA